MQESREPGLSATAPMRTTCGRLISIRRLRLGVPGHRVARVTLDVGPEREGASHAWASLSPHEARELGWRLIEAAEIAEHESS
ncbi:hypothetical protein SRB5_49090 [Streptomyces sp. RB5]|uniref:Uncharacterized protein n=1 Tax=Streptomyces smaragdinus TaxID=2585196 RepID=A0A7K0CN82_9ACTN|nr:hypothetical protein [Streptomyces smaragdinus]MQY14733.1 hypothetical protein [Streptomyces smaragdinus]